MAHGVPAHSPEPHRNRAIYAIGYLAYGVLAIRELTSGADAVSLGLSVALLGAMVLLTATDPLLFRRFQWYRYLYFVLQTGLIQALGLVRPDQDVWGIPYIFIAVQARYYLPVPSAMAWGGVSAPLLILGLMFTTGWAYGLSLGLTYLAGGVLLISWDVFSGQAETARRESQALLAELRQAHEQLRAYAAQIEEQAALRERDRLVHELHDSVGQTIFGIALTAESARLLLKKDPTHVPEQLERLRDLTSSALGQMRSLITQWRAG